MTSSPKFRNLTTGHRQSPVELKEKMRKDYKAKVHNCRGMLMDKLRGSMNETDLHQTLTDLYKSMFKYPEEKINDDELEYMYELKTELVQEELEWWIKESDRSQLLNVDWSSMEDNNNVICPVCQKINLQLDNSNIICTYCNFTIPAHNSLAEINQSILGLVENHNLMCSSDVQFVLVPEVTETHVYLLCESCTEMKLVI